MELELGLKITKVVDDFTSADLLISKDRGGTMFLSRETDTMFILTAHLNGYRRENIKIDINEDGTKITIHGEKPVQEMVMVGWKVVKKDIEMRGFQKSFKIPNGVVLDKIKAKFNDDGSILTISIPKIEKGVISGDGLEELKEDEVVEGDSQSSKDDEVLEGDSQSSKVTEEANERGTSTNGNQESKDKEVKEMIQTMENLAEGNQINETEEKEIQEKRVCDPKEEKENQEVQNDSNFEFGLTKSEPQEVIEKKESEKASLVEENRRIEEIPQVDSEKREEKNEMEEENKCDYKEDDKAETSRVSQPIDQEPQNEGGLMHENEFDGANIHEEDSFPRVEENSPRGKSKLCVPIVVGSALIVSFIVFVFHFIRSKNQTSRRRN